MNSTITPQFTPIELETEEWRDVVGGLAQEPNQKLNQPKSRQANQKVSLTLEARAHW